MERILFVSADGHVTAPLDTYRYYVERQYRPAFDQEIRAALASGATNPFAAFGLAGRGPEDLALIDPRGVIADGMGALATWSPKARLQELDFDGVAGEVMMSTAQYGIMPWTQGGSHSLELQAAGVRAHHRFLADYLADGEGRLFGVADPLASTDVDAMVEELRWCREHGCVAVIVPPGQNGDPNRPQVDDSFYEPFWAACAELDMVLYLHAGYGQIAGTIGALSPHLRQAHMFEVLGHTGYVAARTGLYAEGTGPLSFHRNLHNRRPMWQLMLSGVFDRYPTLKLIIVEQRVDWVPDTIAHLDRRFAEAQPPVKLTPSEYWNGNCRIVASQPRPFEIGMRHELGVDHLMFGVDMPHPESTWPNSLDWVRDTFRGVPEDEARMILGENVVDLYKLDRTRLAEVAESIGPLPDDVLGDHTVDPRLIDHFHKRSAYRTPREKVVTEHIDLALDKDLVGEPFECEGCEPLAPATS